MAVYRDSPVASCCFILTMKPDATRWCQVIEGDPEIPEQQHKHAVKVTAVLVQQEPGNQNKEGPLDRYLTKDAVYEIIGP